MWEIRAEHAEHRYSALLDGERIGHAACVRVGDVVVVPHVYVDAPYRSMGVESDLAAAICADALKDGVAVLANSEFLRRFAYQHPRFDTIVRDPYLGEMAVLEPLIVAAVDFEESRLMPGRSGEAPE